MGTALTFDGTSALIVNPVTDELTLGAGHNLRTGQAVRYGHGPNGSDVNGLQEGTIYYVRVASATSVQLAATRTDALNGANLIDLGAAASGTQHALTPLVEWVQIGTLAGGTAQDAFTLQANGRLSGAIDGGAGANSLQGPDVDTAWTINGTDSGTLTGAGGNPVLIANGFTRIASLIGGGADDAFTVTVAGVLTDRLSGGAGANRLQGADRATAWTIDGADSGSLSMGAPVVFDGTQVNPGGNPFETEISFGAPHNLRVGQAVRYGHGAGGSDVAGLVDGQVYFVVSASAPNVLELAQTRGGPAIVVAAAAQGTAHALTPLAQWVQIGTLVGGTAEDAFTLQANGRLSGAIDGGAGANSLQGPDIDTAWTINGTDSGTLTGAGGNPVLIANGFMQIGSLIGGGADDAFTVTVAGVLTGHLSGGAGVNRLQGADRATAWTIDGADSGSMSMGAPVVFDGTQVNPPGGNPFETEITFGAPHNLRVGQAVRYGHGAGGTDVVGLVDGQVYFVVSASAPNVLELAQTRGGAAIDVGAAAQGTVHELTPVMDFSAIGNLVGGVQADTFVAGLGGSLSGTMDGGAGPGANTLRGADRATAWTIDGADSGSLSMGAPVVFNGTQVNPPGATRSRPRSPLAPRTTCGWARRCATATVRAAATSGAWWTGRSIS